MISKSIVVAVAAGSLLLVSQSARANERDLGNLSNTSDKLVGLCGGHDAEVWTSPDGNNWGCGYKGGGGILCDKDTGCLEETRAAPDSDKPWGLAGLLGLIGLLGLVGRQRLRRNVAGDRAA